MPMALQFVSMKYLNYAWPTWLAAAIYALYLVVFSMMMLWHMNAIADRHGFLDGQVLRDGVPDVRLDTTMVSFITSHSTI